MEGTRRRELDTAHGNLELPIFLPVATRGFVKAVPMYKINEMGIKAMISNSVHLSITPGLAKIEASGGINGFTGFGGSYFTDSGGFQILREELVDIDDRGILFRDKKSGASIKVTPEVSSDIQRKIKSDVAMMLDDCPPYGADSTRYIKSVKRTYEWGKIFSSIKVNGQKRFGIIQGGFDFELRKESASLMLGLDFDGYAIGGLKIGEPKEITDRILEKTVALIPDQYPRYLMGVGDPVSIYQYSEMGIDIFDSTYPTRNARHGYALTESGPVNLKNSRYSMEFKPIEDGCACETCQHYTKAALRELLKSEDPAFQYLVTIHNLDFMSRFMEYIKNDREKAKQITLIFSKNHNAVIDKEK